MSSTEQLEVLEGQTSIEDLLDEPVLGAPQDRRPLQRCLPGLEGLG
ncbi:hypothetical protein [Sinomonas sp.]|jgi:hypothetical protein